MRHANTIPNYPGSLEAEQARAPGNDPGAGQKGSVLVIDDEPFVLGVTTRILELQGYTVFSCSETLDALSLLSKHDIDIVIADAKLPDAHGCGLLEEVCRMNPSMPVVLMTTYSDMDEAIDSMKKGAFDFIIKPFRPEYLLITVDKALRHKKEGEMSGGLKKQVEYLVRQKTKAIVARFDELKNSGIEAVCRLCSMAEQAEDGAGAHALRVGLYASKIAGAMRMTREFIENIAFAAPMHDIGKIAVPDWVLIKPGPLDHGEFELVKAHAAIGHKLLAGSKYKNIHMAATIALTHHERWDGTGYPLGLKRPELPVEGMITMICDHYDVLRSKRPYKPSMGHAEAYRAITEGNGKIKPAHYDPKVLDAFVRSADEFKEIYELNG